MIGSSFEEKANQLHNEVVSQKFTPPVLIVHSMSSFVAQKYLESYALSGLIMVNPVPSQVTSALTLMSEKFRVNLEDHQYDPIDKILKTRHLRSGLLSYYGLHDQYPHSSNIFPSGHVLDNYALSPSTCQPFFSTENDLKNALHGNNAADTVVNLERGMRECELLVFTVLYLCLWYDQAQCPPW